MQVLEAISAAYLRPTGCFCVDNVVNGHASNGHQENGDSSKTRKGEKTPNGENGESPNVPNKKPTSRYMLLTESAKAKQATGSRSSSNPKTRAPDTPESPARTPKRYSSGGTPLVTSKGTDSPKTAFGTRKSTTFLVCTSSTQSKQNCQVHIPRSNM